MGTNELMLFANAPESLALYVTFRTKMTQMFPDVEIKAAKTQITFKARYGFAFVSLPRRKKDCGAIIVSFGLQESGVTKNLAGIRAVPKPLDAPCSCDVRNRTGCRIDGVAESSICVRVAKIIALMCVTGGKLFPSG